MNGFPGVFLPWSALSLSARKGEGLIGHLHIGEETSIHRLGQHLPLFPQTDGGLLPPPNTIPSCTGPGVLRAPGVQARAAPGQRCCGVGWPFDTEEPPPVQPWAAWPGVCSVISPLGQILSQIWIGTETRAGVQSEQKTLTGRCIFLSRTRWRRGGLVLD